MVEPRSSINTRFFITFAKAVKLIFSALEGESHRIFIPRLRSARIVDVAACYIGSHNAKTEIVGIRPGEKIHEVLMTDGEILNATHFADYSTISPEDDKFGTFAGAGVNPEEYRAFDSQYPIMSPTEVLHFLDENDLIR